MGNHIICIGREFCSGGHQIALLLGQKLGLKVYEKDILHMACKYGELRLSKMEAADEKATNPYLFETIHEGNYHVMRGAPTSEALFALQSHEIKRIAGQESCIMVGRCADHIHLYVTIPPKYAVSDFMGYLKGKSSLMIFDRHANLKYQYGNRHFWCRGYYVDTVGEKRKDDQRICSQSASGRYYHGSNVFTGVQRPVHG